MTVYLVGGTGERKCFSTINDSAKAAAEWSKNVGVVGMFIRDNSGSMVASVYYLFGKIDSIEDYA